MAHRDTAEVIKLFNDAFLERDAAKLVDLVADDCIMENTQPAPNGTRYEGYHACLRFWQELIADREGSFEPGTSSWQTIGQRSAGDIASATARKTQSAASPSCTSATGRSSKLLAT
jgi:ketosteroid isomerase-like protein